MSESEQVEREDDEETGEHASRRTQQNRQCRRCGRKNGLVGKYDIFLCRQCFREIAPKMGFKKYR